MSDAPEWFTLEELTQRVAAMVWVEEALSDVLATWAAVEPRTSLATTFFEAARHHRWHGEVLRGCLPTSARLTQAAEVQPPSTQWERAHTGLSALIDPDDSRTRILALEREVYPWLDREVDALATVSAEVSDRHLRRWLRFLSLDHQDHIELLGLQATAFADAPTRLSERAVLTQIRLRSPHEPVLDATGDTPAP